MNKSSASDTLTTGINNYKTSDFFDQRLDRITVTGDVSPCQIRYKNLVAVLLAIQDHEFFVFVIGLKPELELSDGAEVVSGLLPDNTIDLASYRQCNPTAE